MIKEKVNKDVKSQGRSSFSVSVSEPGKAQVWRTSGRMIKLVLAVFFAFLSVHNAKSQDTYIDSLKRLISSGKDDTLKARRLILISALYTYDNPDSSLIFSERALALAQRLEYKTGIASAIIFMGGAKNQLGDFAGSISLGFKALKLCQELNDSIGILLVTQTIGTRYRDYGNYKLALIYLLDAKRRTEPLPENEVPYSPIMPFAIPKQQILMFQNGEIGFSYLTIDPDSAIFHAKQSYKSSLTIYEGGWPYSMIVLGNAYLALNRFDSSLFYFDRALQLTTINPNTPSNDVADTYIGLAALYKKQHNSDSCIFYAQKGLNASKRIGYLKGIFNASSLLADVYEDSNPEEAVKYFRLSKITRDSLYSKEKEQQIQNIALNEELQQQELQQKLSQAEIEYRNRLKIYMLLAGLGLLLIVVGGLWRKNIYKQKSYSILQKQKEEIVFQKAKAENALTNLKSTQSQLIQSEKMASLGELTAGIAHEIQNPLNFVNNFSEINTELLNELKGQRLKVKGEREEQVETEILNDIEENEKKITLHGKRADAIVKGMLQHSQRNMGVQEPTDINALAEEYLRLAYHSYRSKNQNFLAELKIDLDPGLPMVNVIPQDIGRVLLNLFNNAFWACAERSLGACAEKSRGDSKSPLDLLAYSPVITLTTKNFSNKIEIHIRDNGPGIPQKVLDKIFQPFFTTKPTGQGTGLGLSLSYDIIKAHGGSISVISNYREPGVPIAIGMGVETQDGAFTKFIIQIPV